MNQPSEAPASTLARSADLTGEIFGLLQVIEPAAVEPNGHRKWQCLCSCGRMHVVRGSNLLAGQITRCPACSHGKDGTIESDQAIDEAVDAAHTVTVVDAWYHACGEEGGFAIARTPDGTVLAHTMWNRTPQRLNGPAIKLVLVRRALALLVKLGRIRARHPSEGFARWAKSVHVECHAHLFTPKPKLQELWAAATAPTMDSNTRTAQPLDTITH